MAQAVEQALEEKRHLIVEAGTGTGKTLAYLVPVIRSGKRVIISTGTKNLQEQLFYKDVPFLEQALFPNGEGKLNVCYMKGRNNYLCRKKLYDLTDQPVLSGLEEIEHYRAIAAWEKSHADRRPRRAGRAARGQRALAQARRPLRHLPGPEVQRLGDAASSPRCTAGRWRATSSSSTIICSSPTSRSSSRPSTRPMPEFCRKPAP